MKSRIQRFFYLFKTSTLFLATTAFSLSAQAQHEAPIQLDHYLSQVKSNHSGVKGALLGSQAGGLRSKEGQLLLAPTAFAEVKYTADARLPQVGYLTFDNITTKTFSFGVKKLTTFGLQASLHYDILSTYYNNLQFSPEFSSFGAGGGSGGFLLTSYAVASPVLELTQSIWGNGFGSSTQATQEQLEATATASSFQNSYQAKSTLVNAELAYWRLALARQVVNVQKEALDRAKKIYRWNSEKARLHLRDQSDVIQSDAQVKSRELDVKTAEIEVTLASRTFNSMRAIDSDSVDEALEDIRPELVETIHIPKRAEFRDDVKAAQHNAHAASANATVSIEKDKPTLDVFASLTLNGQSGGPPFTNVSDSIPYSVTLSRPTQTVGLRFSAPLTFGTASQSRDGWRQEQSAADLNYSRKVFDQEQDWKLLNSNFNGSMEQFKLSIRLEEVQKSKLMNERDRLTRGRTTTYQVLLFEQDYIQSQLIRIRNEANILNYVAQMKLYGETL